MLALQGRWEDWLPNSWREAHLQQERLRCTVHRRRLSPHGIFDCSCGLCSMIEALVRAVHHPTSSHSGRCRICLQATCTYLPRLHDTFCLGMHIVNTLNLKHGVMTRHIDSATLQQDLTRVVVNCPWPLATESMLLSDHQSKC